MLFVRCPRDNGMQRLQWCGLVWCFLCPVWIWDRTCIVFMIWFIWYWFWKKHAMFVGMDGCLTLVYSTVYILYIYLCACVVGVHVVLLHKCLPLVWQLSYNVPSFGPLTDIVPGGDCRCDQRRPREWQGWGGVSGWWSCQWCFQQFRPQSCRSKQRCQAKGQSSAQWRWQWWWCWQWWFWWWGATNQAQRKSAGCCSSKGSSKFFRQQGHG